MAAGVRRFPTYLLSAAILLALLNLAVFLRRALSLLSAYDLIGGEGAEASSSFAIWRVLHHFALYTQPTRPPFQLTFYNFGFYHTYAAALAAMGIDDGKILLVSRCITLVFAALGAITYYRLALMLTSPEARSPRTFDRVFIVCMAITVWFGTNFIAWWPLCIRPDVGSWFLATLGLSLYVKAYRAESVGAAFVASCAFVGAWTFKQSTVLMFVGVVVHVALVQRNRQLFFAIVAPFATLVGVSLLAGGAAYRFSLLRTPTVGFWQARQMFEISTRISLQNAFVWLGPVFTTWRWAAARRRGAAPAMPSEQKLLLLSFAIAFALGTFALGRAGSNKNHVAEAYLLGSLMSTHVVLGLVRDGNHRQLGLATLLALIPMELFPVAQLVWPNRFGVTSLLPTPEAREQRAALARFVRAAPKPVFIEDEVFSMPWYSSLPDGAGAMVMDGLWYALAQNAHIIEDGGVERMIREGCFKTVVFQNGTARIRDVVPQDYSCAPIAGAASSTGCMQSAAALN